MSRASIISALQSIIANANATTGQSDATVTSATNRLIRGYGGGASNIIADVEVTGDGTGYLRFECEDEPDAVIVYAKEWTPTNVTIAPIGVVAVRNHFVTGVKCTNDQGTLGSYLPARFIDNEIYYPWGMSPGNNYISGSYSDGVFTMYSRGVGQNCWSASYTYRCIGIKF